MISGQVTRLGRRFLLILGGEVLQSAFHFAFNVALVRMLPAWDYGLFAIIMLIGGLALTYVRAIAGMPASLLIPAHRGSPRAGAIEVVFGSGALCTGVLVGLGVAAGLFPLIGHRAPLAAVFVGLWSVRSFLRTALLARQRQMRSAVSDIVFAASGALLALLLLRGQAIDLLDRVFLILVLANMLACVVALDLPGRRVRVSVGRATRRRYAAMRAQIGWSCAGVTTANLQAQGQVLLIAAFAGPAAYAPIAAMLVFFAPLRLVASALANMMQPELAVAVGRGERARAGHLLLVWTGAMLLVGLCCAAATVLALPLIDAPVFVGQPKTLIGVLTCAVSIAPLLYVMPKILLEVLRAFRTIALMASVSAVIGISLVAVLLRAEGPAWSLIGSAAAELMVLAWCWLAAWPWTTSGADAAPRFPAFPSRTAVLKLTPHPDPLPRTSR